MYYLCSILTFILLNITAIAQQQVVKKSVYFDNKNAELTMLALETLNQVKLKCKDRKVISVSIKGYADVVGSTESNQLLGLQRASIVADWLYIQMTDKADFAKTKLVSFGEKAPVNTNKTEEEKALNRRVDIEINIDTTPYISIQALNKYTETVSQKFCIDNKRDTMLIGKQGTMLYIKANSLLTKELIGNCITIELKEALDRNNIMKNNLTTNSDNNILYSQSMVYVQASCGNTPIELAPNKDYLVFSPTTDGVQTAGLYTGELDVLGNINWKGLDKEKIKVAGAKAMTDCNGIRNRCIKFETACTKNRLFFRGLGKLIQYSFQENGKSKKKEYYNCRRNAQLVRRANRLARKSKNSISKSIALAVNPTLAITPCYYPEAGICGTIVYNFNMDCAINFENEIAKSLDSILKNGNPINIQNINQLQYAVFNRLQLGWSNIDWMLKVPEQNRANLYVDLDATPNTDVKIIFSNYKTILRAIDDGTGKLVFPDIPKNEPATLLLVDTRTGKDKILAQKLPITTDGILVTPNFTLMPVAEYAQLLDGFK
jgi:hypothetical protein